MFDFIKLYKLRSRAKNHGLRIIDGGKYGYSLFDDTYPADSLLPLMSTDTTLLKNFLDFLDDNPNYLKHSRRTRRSDSNE